MFRFLHQTEDIMDTELTPTQMAIEFLRRDTTVMTPAQYLKKLKLLELEFADLMALSFFCAWLAASKKIPREAGEDEW